VRYSATASAIAEAGGRFEPGTLGKDSAFIDRNIASMGALTILAITDDAAYAKANAAIAGVLPSARIERVDPGLLRRLPSGAALIVTDPANGRVARATGFEGGILVMATPKSEDERAAFQAQGTEFVEPSASPAEFATALTAALTGESDGVLHAAVSRARRLIAAGEVALKLQHDFNNPLAALMAEVQMLQIDAPNPDVQATADRMLELVRRLTALSRSLDGMRERKTAP
jgi:signal transduction histidine kinase